MKKLRILVDVDGIVADTLPFWLKMVKETTGVEAVPADITKWALHTCPPLTSLRPEQIYDLLNISGFNAEIPMMPGASDNLKALHDAGHDVYLLTARYGDVGMPETIHWLKKHLPWFNSEKKLGFFADKHLVKADVLIDDRGETLLKYYESNPHAKIVTINYPYNQAQIPGVIRVEKNENSWTALREVIEGISNGKL